MPEFDVGQSLLDGDHPLVTTSPGLVAQGAIIPPGHMQKEYTPLPFTCFAIE